MFKVEGEVRLLGVLQTGVNVFVWNRSTGVFLGTDVTDGVGAFSIIGLPDTSLVYITASEDDQEIKIFDQVTPIPE